MKNPDVRSFLRWAGSKKQLLPILKTYWKPSYKRYIEPFAGSACLFFCVHPRRAILGDLNVDLVRMYRCVKKSPESIIRALTHLPKGKVHYKRIRNSDSSELSAAEHSARFIYLNRFCFNGLYRTNKLGKFNVPYGGDRSGSLPSPEQLRACSRLLQGAVLVRGDFSDTLLRVDPGDFVYLDPPFSVAERRTFNEYNAAVFNESDLRRLREWMEKLADRGASFVVSYAESDEGNFLANGFENQRVTVKRHIAGSFTNRIRSNELLISHQATE